MLATVVYKHVLIMPWMTVKRGTFKEVERKKNREE